MLTSAQQDAVAKLVNGGGVARARPDGKVEVRTSSSKSRCEYVVTPAGETILIDSRPQSMLWRLGDTLAIVGAVLFVPGALLLAFLWVLVKMEVVSSLGSWGWVTLVPAAGFCLLVVGLMLIDEEGVLASAKKQFVSSGETHRLTNDLPVGQWVAIATSDGDGGDDGDGDGGGD